MAIFTHADGNDLLANTIPTLPHKKDEDGAQQDPAVTNGENEYFLVRLHRWSSTSSVYGKDAVHEDVHYYRLDESRPDCGTGATAAPYRSSLLNNYIRFTSVAFGQLDPFYYPALQQRHIDREASNAQVSSQNSRWQECRSAALSTGVPIAVMQKEHQDRKEQETRLCDAKQARSPSDSAIAPEHRPPYLLFSALGLAGFALFGRALRLRRQVRAARADARAWRTVALHLTERQSASDTRSVASGSGVSHSRPVLGPSESIKTSALPSEQHATTVESPSRESKSASVTTKDEKGRAQHRSNGYAAVHPHEDWDWMPADFPRTNGSHWHRQRLPPWCIGFSSAPKCRLADSSVERGAATKEQGSDSKRKGPNNAKQTAPVPEDESFIVEVLRDVYGIEAAPPVKHSGKYNGAHKVSDKKLSKINEAIRAHRSNIEACGEERLLSEDAPISSTPEQSSQYDHDELMREVLEERSRQKRQRLRSRLASRLSSARSRALSKSEPAGKAKTTADSNDAMASSADEDYMARLLSHDDCTLGDRIDIANIIASDLRGSAYDAQSKSGEQPDVKKEASHSFASIVSDKRHPERVDALERQVWALLARFEETIRRR